MRIKLFVLPTSEKDDDGAVLLPAGWWPVSIESSAWGGVYVWAYEDSPCDEPNSAGHE